MGDWQNARATQQAGSIKCNHAELMEADGYL